MKKLINKEFYSTLVVSGSKNPLENNGHVYLPFVMQEHTDESLKDYKAFMDSYSLKHKFCPKCKTDAPHNTTLVSFPMYSDRREEYKDLNHCFCIKCKSSHTTHERTSEGVELIRKEIDELTDKYLLEDGE